MKVLLDSCVWSRAKAELIAAGHDVVWSGDWDRDPGDEEILRIAVSESRVLVTLDKDFGELTMLRKRPHCGIVRLVCVRASDQGRACIEVLERYGRELTAGALVTVEPGRVRVRVTE